MSKPFRLFLYVLATLVIGIFLWSIFWPSFLSMGDGSERYARKWSKRFASLESTEAATRKYPLIESRAFADGEWIFGICRDSHASPWGGTIVTRDSRGEIRSFFGHVCGRYFLRSRLKMDNPENLNHFYSLLLGEYKFKEWKTDQNSTDTIQPLAPPD